MRSTMSPRVFIAALVLIMLGTAKAHIGDRPKLPRGIPCKLCKAGRITKADDKFTYMRTSQEGDFAEVQPPPPQPPQQQPEVEAEARALVQRRSAYWPLRHPALDARKRHREPPTFLHPVVRFVQPYSELGPLGPLGPLAGAYWAERAEPGQAAEDWQQDTDNLIRDRPVESTRLMTAEDLIRALQERQWKETQADGDGLKVSALRFGGIGRK